MVAHPREYTSGIPTTALAAALAACVVAGLVLAPGPVGAVGLVYVVVVDLPVAVAIFVAAGGWGWLVIGRLAPADTPGGLLAVTSIAAGLWMLSTAVLVAGSAVKGLLTPMVAWPVVGLGVVAALWAIRKRISAATFPRRVPPISLLLILPALAVVLWLAGASMPAGHVGLIDNDFYDVVSYHLQIPREFHDAGRIGDLPHNTYSHYPLGGHMLFLLAMCLRGGAWAGTFAAKFTHGLWGVLAVATLYAGLPDTWRRRAAPMLLATTPMVLYLSWLAFVELSQLAYLAVAIVWLRRWLARPGWREAALVGLACGGACATKYPSVGLVAAPVLAVMLIAAAASPRQRLLHWLGSGVLCAAVLSPWLIRNTVYTGNPVFPLATTVFGAGPWTAEQAERWDAGHAPAPWADKPALAWRPFLQPNGFGPLVSLMAAAVLGWVVTRRSGEPIDRLCAGVLGVQVLVWTLGTHMPARFLAPAAVPLCILAGGLVAWLGRRGGSVALPIAVIALAAAVGWAPATARYLDEQRATSGSNDMWSGLHGMYPSDLWRLRQDSPVFAHLTPGTRLLLVGDAGAFNFPPGTLYASAWEADPLVRLVRETSDPAAVLRRLRNDYGVTHILINWSEIRRLRSTYGWWDAVTPALVDALVAAGAERISIGIPGLQMLALR